MSVCVTEYVVVLQGMSNLKLCPAESLPPWTARPDCQAKLLYWSMYAARQLHLCPCLSVQEVAQAGTAGLASAAQDGQCEQQRRREGV